MITPSVISRPRQAGIEARGGERLGDLIEEVGLEKLFVRKVDGELEGAVLRVLCAAARGSAGQPSISTKRPMGHDEPRLLGHGEELVRRQQAAPRMLPAHQRLEARHLVRREIDERLIVHPQLAAFDPPAAGRSPAAGGPSRSGASRG